MKITKHESFLGVLLLKWQKAELAGVVFPPSPPPEVMETIEWKPGQDWCDILDLRGIDLVCEGYSTFEWKVWNSTRKIPFGETRSYGWIAREISNPGACRAVGRALGANPWPLLIPCHRVIRSDGTLGGFGSGLEWKRYLLNLEKELLTGGSRKTISYNFTG